MQRIPLISLGLLLATEALAGSTLRCGSTLISTGDLSSEIREKCGTPSHENFLGYHERVDGYGREFEVALEEWVYGPRNGMYYFLRLEGNRLVRIESRRNN